MGLLLRHAETFATKRNYFSNFKPVATFLICLVITSILFVLPLQKLNAQNNTLDNVGLTSSTPASAAFSLRKLSSTYTTGPGPTAFAIQVRRSSDNTTANIGFTAAGDLDQAQLLAFVGAGSGFVTIWYDQSGNGRNAVQATAANQPRIVNAGAIELVNGKPTLRWTDPPTTNATQQRLECPTSTTVRTVNAVRDFVNDPSFPVLGFKQTLFALGANQDFSVRGNYASANNAQDWINGTGTPPTNWVNGLQTLTGTFALHTITATASAQKNGTFSISSNFQGDRGLRDNNHVSELILFSDALVNTDRQILECNQTAYYNIAPANQTASLCSGTAYNLPTVSPAGTTYSWGTPVISPASALSGQTTGTNLTTFTQTLINATASTATATYTITPTYCGNITGSPFTVVIAVSPSIPATPGAISGNTNPCRNLTGLVYSVAPVANATSYTWTMPAGWTISAGSNTNSITVSINATAASGNITVNATNSCGTSTNSVLAATAQVLPGNINPTVETTPICAGTGTNLLLASSVSGINYQLRNNSGNINIGAAIAGTGAGIALPTGNLNSTTTFNILATNAITGCNVQMTNTGDVTVNAPINRTVNPASGVSICYNTSTNITVTSSVAGVSYQLRNDLNNSLIGAAVTGDGNTISLPTGNLTTTTTFNVLATTIASGCTAQMTNRPVVTIKPLPSMTSSAAGVTCSGVAQSFVLTSDIVGTTYSWIATDNTNTTGESTTSKTGATINDNLVNLTAAPQVVTYIVTPTANGCTGTPQTVQITVNPRAVMTSASAATICSGTDVSIPLTSSVAANYSWLATTLNGNVTGEITTAQTTTTLINNLINTSAVNQNVTYTVTPTSTPENCPGTAQTVVVTVRPQPLLTSTATPTAICSGSTFIYPPASNVTGATFTWTRASVAGIAEAAVTTPVAGGVSEVLTNTTTAPINVVYVYSVSFSGCTNPTTYNVTVSVRPTPTATISGNSTVCIGGPGQIVTFTNPQSLPVTVTYNVNGANQTTISISANASNTVTRSTGTAGTFNYNLVSVVYSNAPTCSNLISGTATITVAPLSTITLTSAAGTRTQTVCENSTMSDITYNITGSGAAPTVSNLPAGVTYAFNAGVLTISGTPTVGGVFNYVITTAGPCAAATTNNSGTITVIATPSGSLTATENSGTTPNDLVICSGDVVSFTATSGYGAYEFYLNGSSNANLVQAASAFNTYNTSTLNNNDKVLVKAFDSGCPAFFNDITIQVNPLPIATLTADKTTICPGEAVTFTAADAGVGCTYTFKINGTNTILTGTGRTITTAALPATSFYITVEVTNPNACMVTSAQTNITVNPTSTGTLSATATSFCVGSNVTFTATAGFNNYEFKVNNSTVQGPGASNTYSTTALTNGQVVEVVAKNATGCLTTFNSLPVTVNTFPSATLSITETSGTPDDGIICAGGVSTTLTATPGLSTYNFKVNGISLQNTASNTFTSTAFTIGNSTVTVDVTNSSGCTTANADSKTITVVPLPTGTLTTPTTTICAGDNAVFTASPGFSNYNFRVNGTTVQNGSLNTYTNFGTLTNGQTVTVTVTGTNGCTSTFNTAPATMTVNALPTGSILATETSGVANNDQIICAGATVTFTAPAGFSNYRFILNGNQVQNGGTNSYTNSSLINGDGLTVEVTNSNGCKAILTAPVISVNALPVLDPIIPTTTASVCVGATTTLTNSTSGGVWSSSNNSIATINATTGVVTGVLDGTVTISYTVTNANNCSTKRDVSFTVNPLPAVNSITGPNKVCVGTTITLANTTTGGVWAGNNNAIATVNSVNGKVTGVAPGTVTVFYTVTNGFNCSRTSSYTVTVNALPVLSPITGVTTLCANGTTALANATTGGTGVWTSNNKPFADVNSSTGLVSGVSAGSATIIYTFTDANACVASVNQVVTVNPIPVPTLTGKNPICVGDVEVYTTQSGESNYVWNVVGGNVTSGGTSTDHTIEVNWTATGTKTINVNYANSFGCTASTSSSFTTAPTTPPPTFVSGVPTACLNSTGNIYTTQSGKNDYTWTVNGGTITDGLGTNSITVTWNVAGTKTVSVNYAEPGGCNAANATVYNVTVHPLPTATISASASAACANGTAPVITFTGSGGLSNYTFTYTVTTNGILGGPQTITSSGNTATIAVSLLSPNSTYIYTLLSVQDSRTCGQAIIGPGNAVTVAINALPTVVTNPVAVCSPNTVNLTNGSVTAGSDAGLTYTYFTNAGVTNSYATPAAAVAGTYWIKGTTVAGCFTVKSVLVTVNPLPTATINGTTSVCINGTSPNITFSGATGTAPYTFTYNINGGTNTTVISSGASANVAAPTGTAGSFVYNLVSVQDASSTGCSQAQTGGATITVNPVSVGGSVNGSTTVCTGSNGATITLSGNTGTVIRWESSINAGASWSTIANNTNSYTYSNITQTTHYRAVVQSGVCASVNSSSSIITVNPLTIAGTVSSNATVCAGANSGTLNLAGNNGSVVRWESSVNGGTSWTTIANTTSSLTYTNIVQTTLYRAVVQNAPCNAANSNAVTITVSTRPTGAITGTTAICAGQSATLTISVSGSGTISGTLSDGSSFSGTAPTITKLVTPASNTTYTIATLSDANCTALAADKTGSAVITVNALPPAPQLRPVTASFCEGTILPLSAATSFTTTTATFPSSASLNLSIPDNNATGAANSITVSGIPAGAVINSVSILFRITHGNVGDLVINVKAPNSKVLNLVNREGGTGDNFSTTTISSTGTTSVVGQAAPFNSTFKAEATFNVQGATVLAGNLSDVTSFSSLFDTPNGVWRLSARDAAPGSGGTINNWSVIVNYTVGSPFVPVVWSPATGLYKDAAATLPYSGETLATVYANPASGTSVYSATNTNAASCSVSNNVTLTVNPVPVVSIAAAYCQVPGKVRLTATSVPAGASFAWSTGQTTASIDVDVADEYDVVATLGGCASAVASISVAQELVVNGDFSDGNTGFITGYAYKPNIAGVNNELVPDNANNGYAVGTNGQDYHPNFWGQDHTNNQTGDRNFMLVNGHDNISIWEQTVSVLPNTDYYFSAWAMNLNPGNPARLRFEVNGVQVGTIADLNTAPKPANAQAVNLNNWIRFYSNPTWNSGNATTATIRIVNLNGSAGGNDFGLDDISFGTLSTFITLASGAGSDGQTICLGDAIIPVEYNVGSGLAPTVSTLPNGVTSLFNGVNLIISGTPTIPGDYSYTVTTTGCSPFTATGIIKVKSQRIALSSGTSSQTVCKAAPLASLTYTISGEAYNATITGLPAGVTMTKSGNVFTIAGTPTVAGTFDYVVTTSGIDCAPVTAGGTITVQEQTITLSAGNSNPTLCINSNLPASIQYAIGGTGTGAAATGLPAGITGTYNTGFFTISGTPTVAGTFNYTVTTSGTCTSTSLGGTITVNPAASIVLTTGNATQTTCNNDAIGMIRYTVAGGGTGATVTGLPAGVTGSFNAGVFTIEGTPTQTGVFNYTVTTSGTCAQTSASGTINVVKQEIDLTNGSTTQTLCINNPIVQIIYTISGSATSATVTGLPAGVTVSNVGKVYTISGSPSASGTFNYTITTTGTCTPQATATGSITVQSQTITLTTGNNNQTPCVNLPINNIVYSISGGATGATVSGLPAGITGAYSNGVFTISGTTTLSGTFNFTVTSSGPCVAATATGTLVTGSVIWTGANSTNWSDANNWSCGAVPISATNVVIPTGATRMPQLTATSVSKNIELQNGTTLDLNGQTFTAFGSFTGTGKIKGSANSNVSIAAAGGSSNLIFDQTTDGSTNALKNLSVSGAGNDVTLNNKISIYGTLLPAAGTLRINDTLVLRSNAAGTARVGEVTGTIAYTATGKVSVERYYPMSRSWRLVTSPLSNTGNILNSWQNRGIYEAGKGMFITGPAPSASNGLDYSAFNNFSMRTWNSAGNAYVSIGNTVNRKLSNDFTTAGVASNIGYYAFIRGDRSRNPDNTIFGNMNNTTLSSTGFLQTGSQSFNFTGVASSTNPSFELIGNPYASSVNFNTLSKTNVFPRRFFIYDPSLGTVGLFVTMEDFASPGTFTNALGSTQGNFIQSSQAFFVQVETTGPATLTFKESDKSSDYNASLFRPAVPLADMQSLRIVLLHSDKDNKTLLVDATLAQFDERYNDRVDMQDAVKFTNITENLSLLRHKQYLAVERRPLINNNDTLFLQLSRTTRRNYRFAIEPANLDHTLTAFLEDSYTGKSTPINLSGSSYVDFTIDADAKSSAVNRFRIVFKQAALGPLPVTFKTIKANEQSGKIAVNWTVENEVNIKHYEVEKSADGVTFSKVNTTTATGANRTTTDYNWLDVNPLTGNNFYRVRSIDVDGTFDYSSTVLVKMGKMAGGIRIYPNPVTDIIGAEFKNMAAGFYTARLLNAQGQTVLVKTINHAQGTSMENITPDYKLLAGIYQLEVTAPDKTITMVKVIVK